MGADPKIDLDPALKLSLSPIITELRGCPRVAIKTAMLLNLDPVSESEPELVARKGFFVDFSRTEVEDCLRQGSNIMKIFGDVAKNTTQESPDLSCFSWWHGSVGREESRARVSEALKSAQSSGGDGQGLFLVRFSSRSECYAIDMIVSNDSGKFKLLPLLVEPSKDVFGKYVLRAGTRMSIMNSGTQVYAGVSDIIDRNRDFFKTPISRPP